METITIDKAALKMYLARVNKQISSLRRMLDEGVNSLERYEDLRERLHAAEMRALSLHREIHGPVPIYS